MGVHTSTVAIVGLGLMGGSLALALKANRAVKKIIGITRNRATLDAALARGAIDAASDDMQILHEADIIILAAPVRTIIDQLPRVGELAREGALIIDLGSTKREIARAMDELPSRVFAVGGHPMCGKESSGFEAADETLYLNKIFVLTPTARSDENAMSRATELARAVGSRVVVLDAERHDQIVAAISHLPYLVASNLVSTVAAWANGDEQVLEIAASGFRDTTRLAASDTEMMLDILLTNSENVAELMRDYARSFAQLADLIYGEDEAKLREILERAAAKRRALFVGQRDAN